jgi:hypothetical protein
MTDYVVSFSNGTGGNFLISMIERTVLGDRVEYDPLTLGQYNDAHFNAHFRNFRQMTTIPSMIGDMKEGFLSCVKLNPKEPAFMPVHLYWPEIQFAKWPDSKLAVIIHTEADALDISISGFFKTEMTSGRWRGADGKYYQPNLPPSGDLGFNMNNVIFEGIRKKNPNTLTAEELQIAVRARVAMVLAAGFHLIEPVDDPRVSYIQYRDLVSNPEAVMAFLESTTGAKPPAKVRQDIDMYQARQEKTLSEIRELIGLQ